jgi:hypothetical protein
MNQCLNIESRDERHLEGRAKDAELDEGHKTMLLSGEDRLDIDSEFPQPRQCAYRDIVPDVHSDTFAGDVILSFSTQLIV